MNIDQGDIISVEKLSGKFLVVSKNFFNATEQVILCPIVTDVFCDALHIPLKEIGRASFYNYFSY